MDDAVFTALADPTRRGLLTSIAEHGPVTATSLARELPISRQAVAKHLAQLRAAGLVEASHRGRETRFVTCPERLSELAAWAEATGRLWDRRLARLQQLSTQSGRS